MDQINNAELLSSAEFWLEYFRNEVFNAVENYLKDKKMTRAQLAKKLGVSKGYISQVLNGETDHRLTKLMELLIAVEKAPYLFLKDLNQVVDGAESHKSVFIDFKEMERKAALGDKFEKDKNTLIPVFLTEVN